MRYGKGIVWKMASTVEAETLSVIVQARGDLSIDGSSTKLWHIDRKRASIAQAFQVAGRFSPLGLGSAWSNHPCHTSLPCVCTGKHGCSLTIERKRDCPSVDGASLRISSKSKPATIMVARQAGPFGTCHDMSNHKR